MLLSVWGFVYIPSVYAVSESFDQGRFQPPRNEPFLVSRHYDTVDEYVLIASSQMQAFT